MTPKLTVAASRLITLLDEPSVSIDAFDNDTKHSLVTAIEDTRAALMEVNADPSGGAARAACAAPSNVMADVELRLKWILDHPQAFQDIFEETFHESGIAGADEAMKTAVLTRIDAARAAEKGTPV